jgi:hypothetical protein
MRYAWRITALFQFRGQAQASARSQAIFGPAVLRRKCACVGGPLGRGKRACLTDPRWIGSRTVSRFGADAVFGGRSRSRDALTRPVRVALCFVRRMGCWARRAKSTYEERSLTSIRPALGSAGRCFSACGDEYPRDRGGLCWSFEYGDSALHRHRGQHSTAGARAGAGGL